MGCCISIWLANLVLGFQRLNQNNTTPRRARPSNDIAALETEVRLSSRPGAERERSGMQWPGSQQAPISLEQNEKVQQHRPVIPIF